MNSCILMAEIVKKPELRYTSDNQTPVTEMEVQFPGARAEDPPVRMKVVGWGNLAQEIQERYNEGDRVLLEGRLSMNTIERPEGFKEKRAELTVQRVHPIGVDTPLESPAPLSSPVTNPPGTNLPANGQATPRVAESARSPAPTKPAPALAEPIIDDEIPF